MKFYLLKVSPLRYLLMRLWNLLMHTVMINQACLLMGFYRPSTKGELMMSATIISGKVVAQNLRNEMKEEIASLKKKNIVPHLTVILIGDHPASASYVRGKEKACAEINMSSDIIRLKAYIIEQELLDKIDSLNNNEQVDGILEQLTLLDHIREQHVNDAIDPAKDYDGFHPVSIERMIMNQDIFYPCIPYGIIQLLTSDQVALNGKY